MNNQKCHWKSCLVRVISRVPSLCCRFWQWALRRKASWRSITYLCTPPSGAPTPRVWSTVYRSDPATLYTLLPQATASALDLFVYHVTLCLIGLKLSVICFHWWIILRVFIGLYDVTLLFRLAEYFHSTCEIICHWSLYYSRYWLKAKHGWTSSDNYFNRRWIKAERFLFTCVIVSTL